MLVILNLGSGVCLHIDPRYLHAEVGGGGGGRRGVKDVQRGRGERKMRGGEVDGRRDKKRVREKRELIVGIDGGGWRD